MSGMKQITLPPGHPKLREALAEKLMPLLPELEQLLADAPRETRVGINIQPDLAAEIEKYGTFAESVILQNLRPFYTKSRAGFVIFRCDIQFTGKRRKVTHLWGNTPKSMTNERLVMGLKYVNNPNYRVFFYVSVYKS